MTAQNLKLSGKTIIIIEEKNHFLGKENQVLLKIKRKIRI
jgi:hypothetical protein